jgi:hypothetical protein
MEWKFWLVFFVLLKCLFHALLVQPVRHQKHLDRFSTVSFIFVFILRPIVIKTLFPLPYIICHVLSRKYSTRSTTRTGCCSKLYIVTFVITTFRNNYLAQVKLSVPLESFSSLKLLWSEAVSSSSKLCSISPSNKYILLVAISASDCYFERKHTAKSAVNNQGVCWYMKVMSYTVSKLQNSAV